MVYLYLQKKHSIISTMNLQEQPQKHKEQKTSKFSQAISLLQRKHYGCLSKIFCCKCFYCCQNFDFTLLTSKKRKGAFEEMVKKYLKSMHDTTHNKTNIIMDPFFMLVALLLGQQSDIYNELLQQVSNANEKTIFSKQDLEFYIPQLCTYLVFHEQMSNIELSTLLERACKIDLHFSLRYYFFMKSLEIIDSNFEIKKLPIVEKYNNAFRNRINFVHKIKRSGQQIRKSTGSLVKKPSFLDESKQKQLEHDKTVISLKNGNKKHQEQQPTKIQRANMLRKDSLQSSEYSQSDNEQATEEGQRNIKICRKYNDQCENQIGYGEKVQNLQVTQIYEAFIKKAAQNYPKGLFESTANFFSDIVGLGELLLKVEGDINANFEKRLYQINARLPAAVYIPFTKSQYNGLNIVHISVKQSRIFKTKQRAPFKICFQTFYNPNASDQSSREKKIRSTIQSSRNLKRSVLFEQDIFLDVQGQTELPKQKTSYDILEEKINKSSLFQKSEKHSNESASGISESNKSQINFKTIKNNIWGKLFELKKYIRESDAKQTKSQKSKKTYNPSMERQRQKFEEQKGVENISNFTDNQSRISEKQQKEMINQDKFIDKKEEKMTVEESQNEDGQFELFGDSIQEKHSIISSRSPYSHLPGYKIINLMVKSHDDLRQECFAMQLLQEFERIFKMQKLKIHLFPYEVMPLSHNSGIIQFINEAITIDELMKKQGHLLFVRKNKEKMKNFISSLAGYSLVTYMLQVKDRHNQNIMIKRDGTILHIDYGFFLSSMPGKGVELQKNVPFKLTLEYIEALGGVNSKQFAQFRKLFYQGFNALRKHQHRILILTKLMYSSYGTTMRCFEKGDEAIQKFVSRFNPKNVRTDGQLSLFCQNLINSSIQNWRAKWYDRWQYFAQGILY